MARINISSVPITMKMLIDDVADGKVNFDCAIQRNKVWKQDQKSLFINSILNNYPIPPFFFAKHADTSPARYDGLDGKQRTTSVIEFKNDMFALDANFFAFDRDDVEHDLSNLKYSELPEWAQDIINNHPIQFFYFVGLTEDQYDEIFFRLNNGKPLSAIELTRVKAKSLRIFQDIAKHALVDIAMTEKGYAKFDHETLVMQAWGACFAIEEDDFSFETKVFRPRIQEVEVSDEEMETLINVFNVILNIYNEYALDEATARKRSAQLTDVEKTNKRVSTRIRTRTHLVALTRAVMIALEKDYDIEYLIEWVGEFFGDSRYTTTSRDYNATIGNGSARRDKVVARMEAIVDDMEQYMVRCGVAEEVDEDDDDNDDWEDRYDGYEDAA